MGASDEALRRLGVDPSPGDTPELERVAAALRAELGDERLEELLAEGARLSLDEAVELALSDGEDDRDRGQTNALSPVIARPTMRVFTSRVPS